MGTDHQIDTYYRCTEGRLKLRNGNIEKSLVFYQRPDDPAVKESKVELVQFEDFNRFNDLKRVLLSSLGVQCVVDKEREIWKYENIKIHLDRVKNLRTFLDCEAEGTEDWERQKCQQQIDELIKRFKINQKDLIAFSYSDLILKKKQSIPGGK